MVDLKLNTWYVRRDGQLDKIVEVCPDKHVIDPFRSLRGYDYYTNGSYKKHRETDYDLVKEISHIGILMEIIVEAGLVYNITGDSTTGVAIRIYGPDNQGVIRHGNHSIEETFDTLMTAYYDYRMGWVQAL